MTGTQESKSRTAKASSTVEVEVIKAIGVEGHTYNGIPGMAGPGSEISLSRDSARKLQDTGAIKIKI